MRGVRRPEPKFPAVFSSLNARRVSVRTPIPGNSYQFEWEVFVGQTQHAPRWRPDCMRGVCRSEPGFLAIFTSVTRTVFQSEPKFLAAFTTLDLGRFSVSAEIPGDVL